MERKKERRKEKRNTSVVLESLHQDSIIPTYKKTTTKLTKNLDKKEDNDQTMCNVRLQGQFPKQCKAIIYRFTFNFENSLSLSLFILRESINENNDNHKKNSIYNEIICG